MIFFAFHSQCCYPMKQHWHNVSPKDVCVLALRDRWLCSRYVSLSNAVLARKIRRCIAASVGLCQEIILAQYFMVSLVLTPVPSTNLGGGGGGGVVRFR